jgi:hypothetical protein
MQPTKKISQLPQTTAPTTSDKAPIVSGGITDYVLLSDLITLFSANVPAGANSQVTRGSETFYDFVANNTGVWTADSVGVNRNASMTALTIYINGRRISVSAVTARTFTASVDTYVDVLDNLDGTGTLVYTTAVNNAASPALAANSVRIAIIVTGATTIAATTSINQGQESRILPIVSSVPYAVTDSLGNLICPRDPNRRLLGLRQILVNFSTSSASAVQVTGLSVPFIAPAGRKISARSVARDIISSGGSAYMTLTLWDGTVGSGTQLTSSQVLGPTATSQGEPAVAEINHTPSAGSHTYNAGLHTSSVTAQIDAATTYPAFLKIEQY